jgi:tRNA nucleotidyltransferase/poly(A) polymerase
MAKAPHPTTPSAPNPPERARAVAASIVARLREAGQVAYFAGGCVRDELLGLHPTDYDVATDAPPQRVRELFARTAEVGAAFGVMLVHEEGVTVEVATFRSEGPYSDARRPDVVRFSDAPTDARRRDFTINALLLDPLSPPDKPAAAALGTPIRGQVIDYVRGLADLRQGVIRAVGDPDTRLAEDHLRALRAIRFSARLGFSIDPATSAAIRRHAQELRGVSRERIGEELRRMLLHPSRARAIALLQEHGLDAPVLESPPVTTPPRILTALEPLHARAERVYGVCLGAWALDRAAPLGDLLDPGRARELASAWRRALCLGNDERDALQGCLIAAATIWKDWASQAEAARKRTAAGKWFKHALQLVRAIDPARAAAVSADMRVLADSASGINPTPLITGDDLIAIGQKPGPRFREVLDRVYDAQLEGRIRSKAEALELAKRLGV